MKQTQIKEFLTKIGIPLVEPDTCFHYTSFENLFSILENDDLFMSNVLFMNDKMELLETIKVFYELKNDDEIKLKKKYQQMMEKRGCGYYVSSFCQKENILSQWCKYSNNASGVAIEFDWKNTDLESKLQKIDTIIWGKPIYEEKIKKEICDKIKTISSELYKLKTNPDYTPSSDWFVGGLGLVAVAFVFAFPWLAAGAAATGYAIDKFSKNKTEDLKNFLEFINEEKEISEESIKAALLHRISPFFKDESFKEEDEIRMVYYRKDNDTSTIQHRFKENRGIIPYVSIKKLLKDKELLKNHEKLNLPISKIWIGSCENREWIKESLEYYLKQKKLNIKIEQSKIPYRG